MTRTRTTLTIDEAVLRAVKVRAARTGRGESEDDAMALALEAQEEARRTDPR